MTSVKRSVAIIDICSGDILEKIAQRWAFSLAKGGSQQIDALWSSSLFLVMKGLFL